LESSTDAPMIQSARNKQGKSVEPACLVVQSIVDILTRSRATRRWTSVAAQHLRFRFECDSTLHCIAPHQEIAMLCSYTQNPMVL